MQISGRSEHDADCNVATAGRANEGNRIVTLSGDAVAAGKRVRRKERVRTHPDEHDRDYPRKIVGHDSLYYHELVAAASPKSMDELLRQM